MAACEVCGNTYDKPLRIETADRIYIFDCFECAIHLLAPTCERCGCRVIGHGVEVGENMYCCAHCARDSEPTDAPTDRVHVAEPPS